MYDDGLGIGMDHNKAFKLYKKAADQDHTLAQYKLGCMYYEARGVNQDFQEAIKYLKKQCSKIIMNLFLK